MGFLLGRQKKRAWGPSGDELIPRRTIGPATPYINETTARRHSAVWAALRLRADLVSTMPIDVYRMVDGIQIEAPKPPVLITPGGEKVGINEWMYSSQQELDSSGNSIGIVRKLDGLGLPARIDLQSSSVCSVVTADGGITKYRINGTEYDPSSIWHEKQYTVAGIPVGLSPIAYAAWVLGEYVSIQQFVTNWFSNSAVPRARLRNTEKKLKPGEATIVKEAWRASQSAGEPFVHGNDWEYGFMQAETASADWLQAVRATSVDIARFFGVPSDLIDAQESGQSVTYANITQRNLQFLIMNLGPAITRRENALSALLSRPRFVKLNADALLRMDPMSRAQYYRTQIYARILAPSEARQKENRPPFTPEQMAEFDALGLNKQSDPAAAG